MRQSSFTGIAELRRTSDFTGRKSLFGLWSVCPGASLKPTRQNPAKGPKTFLLLVVNPGEWDVFIIINIIIFIIVVA